MVKLSKMVKFVSGVDVDPKFFSAVKGKVFPRRPISLSRCPSGNYHANIPVGMINCGDGEQPGPSAKATGLFGWRSSAKNHGCGGSAGWSGEMVSDLESQNMGLVFTPRQTGLSRREVFFGVRGVYGKIFEGASWRAGRVPNPKIHRKWGLL